MQQKTTHACGPKWDEAGRLASLRSYEVLDTPAEPVFDEITRVASLVCRAPIALVSLVDADRQFFKSELGLGVRETGLDISFCAHALREPDLFVVKDATKDERFASNPLVTGDNHIRFYAGAVLEDAEGLPIGTLCVLDRQARPEGLTHEEAETIRALAKAVVAHFELRRTSVARDLLAREMAHRIKNIFAVIAALASASARDHPEAAAFVRTFRDRITALGQATEYGRAKEGGAQVRAGTVHGLLRLLLTAYEGSVVITGDDAPIGSKAAAGLALIIHEQATNAVKYGALSKDAGRVIVEGQKVGDSFRITWRELGGPAVSGPPQGTGFGTLLGDRTVQGELGGHIVRAWLAEGLTVAITVPQAELAR